jgi:Fe-S-cluster containining protein
MPDLIAVRKMAEYLKTDYRSLMERYMQMDKTEAGVLQMQLPCAFLKEGICSIYPVRSLICRFYICTDILGATQQLIYSITMTGITAAAVWAEKEGLVQSMSNRGQSSFDLLLQRLLNEYRGHKQVKLFLEAENYSDIPLQPFLNP